MGRQAPDGHAPEAVRSRGELKAPHRRIDRSPGPDRVLRGLDEGRDAQRHLGKVRGQVEHGPYEGGVRVEALAALPTRDLLLERTMPAGPGGGGVPLDGGDEVTVHRSW